MDSETVAYHFHEPLGVVGQIIPELPAADGELENGPALAAGNCGGAETRTSYSAFCTAANGNRVGDLPPLWVVNVVNGAGGEIGEYLGTLKRIAKVAFTGSTEVGQQIAIRHAKHYSGDAGAGRQIAKYLLC